MSALFVSDLHIDADRPHVLEGLKQLVEREAPSADALYILGDLVEVWIGDDDDSETAEAVREALSRAARICPLRIMHGNRDFLFGQRFARDVGGELIEDPHIAEIGGQRVLLTHGDALCTEDTAYQLARRLFRSEAWQRDLLGKSLEERRELARQLRRESRRANANKPENIMDVTPDEVAALMRRTGCATLIHGHTHRPGVSDVPLGDMIGTRYVLGDWDRCGWFIRFDKAPELACFPL